MSRRRFRTGDLGRQDAEGWLYITSRLKDRYELENGKYACPGPVEEVIASSRALIGRVVPGGARPGRATRPSTRRNGAATRSGGGGGASERRTPSGFLIDVT